MTSQALGAVAVGTNAGYTTQGAFSVAIGYSAGQSNQASNCIVINGSGSSLENTTTGTCVIKPIRTVTGGVAPAGFSATYYNPTTGELIVVTT